MTWNSSIGPYLYGFDYKPLFDSQGTLSVIPIKFDNHKWKDKKKYHQDFSFKKTLKILVLSFLVIVLQFLSSTELGN